MPAAQADVLAPGSDGGDGASDANLVHAMAQGDPDALAHLYDRYSSLLLGIGMRVLRDRREAEDLLHDVFLEAWQQAHRYDPNRGGVRTWLAVRMRSRALDVLKSARVVRSVSDDGLEQRVQTSGPGDGDAMSAGPDHARVVAAMAQLSADQRRVVELAYFDGLSCSEIATTINIPIGTVKSRVAAAMTKLRGTLLPRGPEPAIAVPTETSASQNPLRNRAP